MVTNFAAYQTATGVKGEHHCATMSQIITTHMPVYSYYRRKAGSHEQSAYCGVCEGLTLCSPEWAVAQMKQFWVCKAD